MMSYVEKHCLFCHLSERLAELYPRTFSESDLTPEVFSARRTTEHFHYRIVRCLSCGLVFSKEILPEETMLTLYARSRVTFGAYTDIIRTDYWNTLEPFLGEYPRERALEIGCSTGFFLEELQARGFREVAGCEPSREARQRAVPAIQETIRPGFFRHGMFPQEHFDLVCAFQTLDHLSEPLEMLREAHLLLKPGGLGFFITHDVESLQARVLRGRSPIFDVEHIYLFGKATLRKACELGGLQVLHIGNLTNNYPLEYWLAMSPLPQFIHNIAGAFLARTGVGQRQLSLKAGNIFVIAQRPIGT